MNSLYTLCRRLRSLLRANRLQHEMDEELRFHLERRIENNIKAGMTQKEARYAALRAFGGVDLIKEECRDMRGTRLIGEFRQDLRFLGVPGFRQSPFRSQTRPKVSEIRGFDCSACLGVRGTWLAHP